VTAQAPTDQVGTELLFENDSVRVWSMELAPGETSPVHRHQIDYLIAYVTPSRISLIRDGVVVQTDDFKDGYVQYIHVPQPIVHQITNAARAGHRQLIVELKVREGLSPTSDNGRKVPA